MVSVPLPGFSGLRLLLGKVATFLPLECFSPVAGIQWVETIEQIPPGIFEEGFSPVAGIQWVETFVDLINPATAEKFQSRCRDSVG